MAPLDGESLPLVEEAAGEGAGRSPSEFLVTPKKVSGV